MFLNFKHACFYTDFCDRDTLTHRCHYKQRFSYKGMHLHEELSHTDVLTQTYSYMICHRGHPCPAKGFSKQMQSRKFTADFDNRGAKGLREHKQNRNFTVFSTQLAQGHLRKTVQTQKAVISPQSWRSRRILCETGYAKPSKRKKRNVLAVFED